MPRTRKRPIEVLTPEEVERLIQANSNRAPSGIRNRALVALMYYSGLRLSEVLALLPRDVDLEGGEINVRRGKGGRQRCSVRSPRWLASPGWGHSCRAMCNRCTACECRKPCGWTRLSIPARPASRFNTC